MIRCEHGQEVLPCRDAARLSSSCPTQSATPSSNAPASIRHRIETSSAPRSSCSPLTDSTMTSSPSASISRAKSSVSGASGSTWNASRDSMRSHGAGVQPAFPPDLVVAVKRLACELPATLGLPLARFTIPELHRAVVARGLVAQISGTTLWRWLSADAIKPWRVHSWIFPRDPHFAEKAGRVLDLYHRTWDGRPLRAEEYVLSADEKTSIQARRRCHASTPPRPRHPIRVEHEYERRGAYAVLGRLGRASRQTLWPLRPRHRPRPV